MVKEITISLFIENCTQGAEDYLKSQENAEVIMLNVKSRLQNITSTITIAMLYIYIFGGKGLEKTIEKNERS